MSMHLPLPPKEVPAVRSLDGLAPKFRVALLTVLAQLPDAMIAETVRTPERQAFLYGFGREYDDGRGIVTQAPTNLTSWHGYGCAADVIHRRLGWDASALWFRTLGEVAKAHGLTWGGDWHRPDLPHLQWTGCTMSPTNEDRRLLASLGVRAVWESVNAL
jgi:peptidoglycan LD-endopeptidase CwlK